MTQDQVFVPFTRSERGLPPLNPTKEDRLGARVSEDVKKELVEALGDSPIGATITVLTYLVRLSVPYVVCSHCLQLAGWPSYLILNASGQSKYAKGTNRTRSSLYTLSGGLIRVIRLQPKGSPLFAPPLY